MSSFRSLDWPLGVNSSDVKLRRKALLGLTCENILYQPC